MEKKIITMRKIPIFIPAMIKKLHKIKNHKKPKLKIWGDGSPKREIIYVEDLAEACVYFMKKKTKKNLINIGTGIDYSIKEYAKILAKIIIPNKKILFYFDKSKPNGTPRKVMDVSLAKKVMDGNLNQNLRILY